jgi:hypothetical protein
MRIKPLERKARPITYVTSTAPGIEMGVYTHKLFGMNSLKDGAM